MSNVTVQKIREANQSCPFLQETVDLLDRVRARALELFERRGGAPGNDVGDWLQAEKEVFQVPGTELTENNGDFHLQFALPGFEAKDIRVVALPDAVVVEGEATHQHHGRSGTIHFCELSERRVFRQIPLPQVVDVNHVSATLDKGVLHIRAAKAEQEKENEKEKSQKTAAA